jgi:phosphohistidine phosphatase
MLLRHAKSSWADPTLADVDRPLSPRGERASKKIAKHMLRNKARPDLVLCSSSLRTRQTLAAIAPSLGTRCSIEVVPELYAASAEELFERLRMLPDSVESVMIIGHNPGLHDLALALASRGTERPRLHAKFPTGALATLALRRDTWAALHTGDAKLVGFVAPRELS